MAKRLSSLSIRASVLLAIIFGVVVPELVLLAVDRQVTRDSNAPVIERTRSAMLVLGTAMITEPAWTLSEPGLGAAMDRLLREPSVCAVDVLDLQPAGTPMDLSRRKCAADHAITTMDAPVLHEGQQIARLRLGFDDTEIDRLIAERARITAWLVAAQVIAGVLVLTVVLSLRLLQPIRRLKLQASTLALREPLPPVEWTRRDELGQLGQHLNHVRQHIQDLFDELQTKNEELRRLAMYDHLTGLPNRTMLAELFVHHAAAARRNTESMALMFIDLDRFKTINDTLGHAAGDEFIAEIGKRLAAALRESDIVCRMGGDEFLVLLPRVTDSALVASTCERVQRAIECPLFLPNATASTQTTASIGVAMYPADAADFEALARMADLAMYRSKELGRARHSFYQPDFDRTFRERLELERELKRAIRDEELVLHYQPIFDARRGRIVGCEALVRWQHPTRGLLPPAAFIDAAEETGLIREIGTWTLQTACRQFAEWRELGVKLDYVAVNVSVLQAHDPALPDVVRAAIRRHGLIKGQLELELTESALLSDTEGAMRTVTRLRDVGATLVVDDFGTGYSSLSYLKLLKPDKLKIDRSFVRDLPEDADDRALTQAIIGIAHTLAIDIVAEGVESPAQHTLLLDMGCVLQQGYLHGRPVAPSELVARLLPQVRGRVMSSS